MITLICAMLLTSEHSDGFATPTIYSLFQFFAIVSLTQMDFQTAQLPHKVTQFFVIWRGRLKGGFDHETVYGKVCGFSSFYELLVF